MMDLVLRLREARRLSGLSQKDAAKISGIGEKTISSFETGQRIGSLKVRQLDRLLAAYKLTREEFFSDHFEKRALTEKIAEEDLALARLNHAISKIDRERRTTLIHSFIGMTALAEQSERRGRRLV